MCGIVGYVGEKSAQDVLVAGLKHMEYRGYDSAGIALAAIVIALGAAQLATLLAYDVPQYSEGREGGPAEYAIVGEKGKEAIITREGDIYETPNSPTFTFLPMGSTVIPHEEWIQGPA